MRYHRLLLTWQVETIRHDKLWDQSMTTRTAGAEPDYWDAALETQSRSDWDQLKLVLLQRHLQHAYFGSPYYRASFDAAGIHPDQMKTLDDICRFPFLTKQVLRERQIAVPP